MVAVDERVLAERIGELVHTLATSFDPASIIVFDSVADGTDWPDSDIDRPVAIAAMAPARRRRPRGRQDPAGRRIAILTDLYVSIHKMHKTRQGLLIWTWSRTRTAQEQACRRRRSSVVMS